MTLPLLIAWYLATLFVPTETTKFTLSCGSDPKITFVRKPDFGFPGKAHVLWAATNDAGEAAGTWSASDFQVTVIAHGLVSNTVLSKHLKIDTSPNQKKQVFIDGRPVSVTVTDTTVTFTQDKDGMFAKPVVITFIAK